MTRKISPCILTREFNQLCNRVVHVCDEVKYSIHEVEKCGIYESKGLKAINALDGYECKTAAAYIKRLDRTVKTLQKLGYDTQTLQYARRVYLDAIASA